MTASQAAMLTRLLNPVEFHHGQPEVLQAKLDEIVRHVFPSDHYVVMYRRRSRD